MATYGASATSNEGTRHFVIDAETAEQAVICIAEVTGSPETNIQVFMFEELLSAQYGGVAELATI